MSGNLFQRMRRIIEALPIWPFPSAADEMIVNGIRLKRRIGGFEADKIRDYEAEAPERDLSVVYRGHLGVVTVYVYTGGHRSIPDGPMSEIVKEEFEEATRGVLTITQSQGADVELIERYATGSPSVGPQFLCAVFEVSDTDGTRRTYLYLTGARNRFVKIRATLSANGDAADKVAREFADVLATRLWHSIEPRSELQRVEADKGINTMARPPNSTDSEDERSVRELARLICARAKIPDDVDSFSPVVEKQLRRIFQARGRSNAGDRVRDSKLEQAIVDPAEYRSTLWIEAICAYLTDPGYVKAVAPDAARVVRKRVNTNPELSKIVIFN